MRKVIVLDRQNIFDIAIHHCGSAEAAFAIAVLNAKSITDDLVAGEVLQLPTVANRAVAEYYTNNKLQPATGITEEQMSETVGEGINFMGIEVDFIVS